MFCEESLGNIKLGAFPKRVGARILSFGSVDYFGASAHYSVSKKKLRILITKIPMIQLTWKIQIPTDMRSPTWETRIPSDMCSPTWETHIPSNMCSPTWETHILIVRSLSAKYRPDRYRRDKSVKFGTELP